MKAIESLLDKWRIHFSKGGRFERLEPLFDAMDTIFFLPAQPTRLNPFVRDSLDLKRFMSLVIVAMAPSALFGIYNAGHQSLLATGMPADPLASFIRGLFIFVPLLLISYGVGGFWEVLFSIIRRHKVSEGFLVTGLLFPLTLPPTIPLWQAALGISFGVVIGKEVFGGTGRNFLNPALTGRAFLFFSYPASMSGDNVWVAVGKMAGSGVDAVSGATALGLSTLVESPGKIESALADAGLDFWTLFFGNHTGSIGETSAFFAFLGAGFLILIGIANYRIVISGVLGVLATGFLLNLLAGPDSSPWLSLNPFYHLAMGGAAFGLAYMATDPVSAPGMDKVKWIYGFLIGALTVVIRVFNPAFSEGVMLAILFMNVFSPLLDEIEIRLALKKRIPNA